MLSALRITNLAIVEDLSLDLHPGFTVLTGETGAGKSLLVEALAMLLGARGDSETVRSGADRATVDGVVEGDALAWTAFLNDRGLPMEHPVVLRREVSAAGRSRAWINGSACALQDLRDASRLWIRLTSQHDHQALLGEERHLALLDEVMGLHPDLGGVATAVREAEAALAARRRSEADRERRLEELEAFVAELDKLNPKPGEWTQLKSEREPLRHAAKLEAAFKESAGGLGAALPLAESALRALAATAPILPESQGELDRLRSLVLELEDLRSLAEQEAQRWASAGAERIDTVESRLAAFERLARRHHCEPDELAGMRAALLAERRQLLGEGLSIEELEAALEQAGKAYLRAAEGLHRQRGDVLKELERGVQKRLAHLGMKGARLQARLTVAEAPGSPVHHLGLPVRVSAQGFSALSFWMESNPGEGFRPLAKIASGGELSRVMLALQGSGLAREGVGQPTWLTLVLDEVDAGLGGEAALAVGEAIHDLGTTHQVLAVTHLPQVAARAHHHGVLRKATAAGRTRSELEWVNGEARIRELARLLSGHPDRPEALEHARTLLKV
jgi:DNA repair protein RecN (Recombination protein N)